MFVLVIEMTKIIMIMTIILIIIGIIIYVDIDNSEIIHTYYDHKIDRGM